MSSSIGSVSFISMRGNLALIGEAVETWTRRGSDGLGIRKIGMVPEPVFLSTLADVTGAAGAKTAALAYKALQGSLQTITDDTGQTYSNVLIRRVNIFTPKKVLTSVGGLVGGDHLLRAQWEVQATVNTA